jgi:hypothetical protein
MNEPTIPEIVYESPRGNTNVKVSRLKIAIWELELFCADFPLS